MTYEVRKDGQVYMSATHESCRYPPAVEAGILAAGFDIYIDGKRQKKIKSGRAGRKELRV